MVFLFPFLTLLLLLRTILCLVKLPELHSILHIIMLLNNLLHLLIRFLSLRLALPKLSLITVLLATQLHLLLPSHLLTLLRLRLSNYRSTTSLVPLISLSTLNLVLHSQTILPLLLLLLLPAQYLGVTI